MRLRLELVLGGVLLVACEAPPAPDPGLQRMRQQPRYDRYDPNPVFADGATLQAPPSGSVAREQELVRPHAGRTAAGYRTSLPFDLDRALLREGRQGWRDNCVHCHGVLADGDSFVAARMQDVPPADLQRPRYRTMPVGRLYEAVSQGYGAMPAFVGLLDDRERWAIVAWLRCLQRSQQVVLDELPAARRRQLEEVLP